MKSLLLIVVFVGLCSHFAAGHAKMSVPQPRQPSVENTTQYCGNQQGFASSTYSVQVQAGKRLTFQTQTNGHNNDNNVQLYLLAGVVPSPTSNDIAAGSLLALTGTTTTNLPFTASANYVTVPSKTSLGMHTLVWVWDNTWYSCSEISVTQNDGLFQCADSRLDCHYIGPGTDLGSTAQGGICNQQTGNCTCLSGYSGQQCEINSNPAVVVAPILALLVTLCAFLLL